MLLLRMIKSHNNSLTRTIQNITILISYFTIIVILISPLIFYLFGFVVVLVHSLKSLLKIKIDLPNHLPFVFIELMRKQNVTFREYYLSDCFLFSSFCLFFVYIHCMQKTKERSYVSNNTKLRIGDHQNKEEEKM